MNKLSEHLTTQSYVTGSENLDSSLVQGYRDSHLAASPYIPTHCPSSPYVFRHAVSWWRMQVALSTVCAIVQRTCAACVFTAIPSCSIWWPAQGCIWQRQQKRWQRGDGDGIGGRETRTSRSSSRRDGRRGYLLRRTPTVEADRGKQG